jgi:hypothetical protein
VVPDLRDLRTALRKTFAAGTSSFCRPDSRRGGSRTLRFSYLILLVEQTVVSNFHGGGFLSSLQDSHGASHEPQKLGERKRR